MLSWRIQKSFFLILGKRVARHDKMVGLVERILALHKKLDAAAIPADKELYRRQIETTDQQIDALVCELYELTDEEIKIIEEAAR